MEFSANLGFLFTDLPFPQRIAAAARAGFGAVEFHDQAQSEDLRLIGDLLRSEGLRLCSLNCAMGSTAGSAALAGEEARFRAEFLAARDAAEALEARAIHVMTGRVSGAGAEAVLLRNLEFALTCTDRLLLLEVISPATMPGYWLNSPERFEAVAAALPDPRLRLMADWYHFSQICGPAALSRLRGLAPHLGHLQLARAEDRGDPLAEGLPCWPGIRALALEQGLDIGLEYRPSLPPAEVLTSLRASVL
ncbi:TIM barrel protein [Falsigemmobacter faecalis]|uniref:Hydroxypyruvate isomerase n=1 Tax=Falsigemmobacter faecalis TaxID=2488730 RepID=A0A3P3DT70_9RHOB|nr:TIM barrel protein [Falsigemmobacter faecalis]RRH76886.1 hydroxypyruvate isomerase [Falsigemmobacter faecalis]